MCVFRRYSVYYHDTKAIPEEWKLCVLGESVCVGVYCPLPYWGQSNWQSWDGTLSNTTHTHTQGHIHRECKSEEIALWSATCSTYNWQHGGISRGFKRNKKNQSSDVWCKKSSSCDAKCILRVGTVSLQLLLFHLVVSWNFSCHTVALGLQNKSPSSESLTA